MLEQALILAGGLGTRFRPVRDDIPKALAPVGGKPVLEHQLTALAAAGIGRVVLCVGYLHEQIEDYFGDGHMLGLDLRYSLETEALGTGGAVAHARAHVEPGMFAVINGDTLMPDLDYQAAAKQHAGQKAPITMVVTAPPDAGAYGVVKIKGDCVTGFCEKQKLGEEYAQERISAGVYLFDSSVLDVIPRAQKCSMEEEIFPAVIREHGPLAAYNYKGFFGDMGTPQGYARTERYLRGTSQ